MKKIECQIEKLEPFTGIHPVRRILAFMTFYHGMIDNTRYLDRPKRYRTRNLALDNGWRFQNDPARHRNLLQMTASEFKRLCSIFGGDIVFQSKGKRPQAPAPLQLAVAIHRMASGNTLGTIATIFDICGTSKALNKILADSAFRGRCRTFLR